MMVISKARRSAGAASCLSHLRAIDIALVAFAHDNADYFPDPLSMDQSWEAALQPYASDHEIFACPADQEVAPAVGSSYDWRDTGVANTTLAGHTIHDCSRAEAVLVFESLPGWHDTGRMNVARMDGSVGSLEQDPALLDLNTPIRLGAAR